MSDPDDVLCARCGHVYGFHSDRENDPFCDWMDLAPGCICGCCWEVSCACEGFVLPGSPVPSTCCHTLHLINLDLPRECLKCGAKVSWS